MAPQKAHRAELHRFLTLKVFSRYQKTTRMYLDTSHWYLLTLLLDKVIPHLGKPAWRPSQEEWKTEPSGGSLQLFL